MGPVYQGIHMRLEQEVVLKVCSTRHAPDASAREKLIQVVRDQAHIFHPHVVPIRAYLESGDDIYLITEYITGETLDQRLATARLLPQETAVSICHDVLAALEFMHARGVIHRNIKPENIMLTEEGVVKVTDFDLANVLGDHGGTKSGLPLTTLWYMSPEQIQGQQGSVAADLYALGITLYQMVAGRVPFTGDTAYSIMRAHIAEVPEPPVHYNAAVSQHLGQVILQALAKQPEQRYHNAHDFRHALETLVPQSLHTPEDPTPCAAPMVQQKRPVPSWHPVTRVISGSALLALMLAVGFWSSSALKKPAPTLDPPMQTALPADSAARTVPGSTTEHVATVPQEAQPAAVSPAVSPSQERGEDEAQSARPSDAEPVVPPTTITAAPLAPPMPELVVPQPTPQAGVAEEQEPHTPAPPVPPMPIPHGLTAPNMPASEEPARVKLAQNTSARVRSPQPASQPLQVHPPPPKQVSKHQQVLPRPSRAARREKPQSKDGWTLKP